MVGSRTNPYAQQQESAAPAMTLEQRNAMVEEYLPLVKYVAGRIAGRLPSHVEIDDLINAGVIGLIDAIDKFDATRKIKFKTYAEFRVKGAILDELRALDWVPRSTRQKASRIEKAFTELEQQLGRVASDHEVVEFMGVSFDQYHQMVGEAKGISLISLDEITHEDEADERNLLEFLTDPNYVDPSEVLNLDQVYRIVADSIDDLPEKERLVISLYYYEELTMKEIGGLLEITESRVSQIHTKAILRLRGRLLKSVEL
ncbi:FliA/WhiG family RNA polymerase sigma factor [bacterium]|nr:FliA/WhiG family RNA polymerase sigma factor [bacterium]